MRVGGVMGYVTLDVSEPGEVVRRAPIGTTGDQALDNNGYIVYFSDRRGNHNEDAAPTAHVETGEYGFEDFVNPANDDGAPNNTLDGGTTGAENVNELSIPVNTTRETYGEDPADLHWLQRLRRGMADALQHQHPALAVVHVDQRG